MAKIFSLFLGLVLLGACTKTQPHRSVIDLDSSNSIIGGHVTPEKHFAARSTVALLTIFEGLPTSFCTGTLISKNLILTAAHCLASMEKEEVFVHIDTKLPLNFENQNTFKVTGWKVHPEYHTVFDENDEAISGANDIALLMFTGEISKSAIAAPVGVDQLTLNLGQKLTLAGFGLLEELNSTMYAEELHHVQVSVAKLIGNIIVTDQTSAKGACAGDSGGPAFLKVGSKNVVVGVTRGPHDKALDCRHYGEYTATLKYKEFITNSAAELGAEIPQFVDSPSKF